MTRPDWLNSDSLREHYFQLNREEQIEFLQSVARAERQKYKAGTQESDLPLYRNLARWRRELLDALKAHRQSLLEATGNMKRMHDRACGSREKPSAKIRDKRIRQLRAKHPGLSRQQLFELAKANGVIDGIKYGTFCQALKPSARR